MHSISQRILSFNEHRLPKTVRIKYEAMAENPYRFYRGANHVFFEDLHRAGVMPPAPIVWACGDLHLENFGTYKSDNRLVYFDLNDFDESALAPASWELTRLLVSILVAFKMQDIDQKKAVNMCRLFLKSYAAKLVSGRTDYIERQTARGIVRKFLKSVSKRKQEDILAKRTVLHKKKLEILLDDPRHLELDDALKESLCVHIQHWLKNDGDSPYNYKVTDAVFRIAGTGSLGLKRYAFLLRSLNDNGEKYLLIDMKEASPSSLAPLVSVPQPEWTSEAERVVTVQRWAQNRPPALLSTTIYDGTSFIMQEMQPTKDSIDFRLIKEDYRDIYQVVDDMAVLTASSHLRASGHRGAAIADELMAFGGELSWQEEILSYAVEYAFQVKRHYDDFTADYKAGLLNRKKIKQ